MPFTVNEYLDLVRLLGEQPEWRSELRRLLLTDDLLQLPSIVQRLAEAQERTEVRLERLESTVQRLAEAQERTEARLERLAEAQERTEDQLQQLGAAVQKLAEIQQRLVDDVSGLKGWALEQRYRAHAYGYFGRWMRRARAVDLFDLVAVEEAYHTDQLSDEEWEALSALDLIVQGRLGKGEEAQDAFVAMEVSFVIDTSDVERAQQRAELLRRLGYTVFGAVGGEAILESAKNRAKELGVTIALDGRIESWGALGDFQVA